MNRKTLIIVGVVIIAIVLIYFAYVKFVKPPAETTVVKGSIDCKNYYSLNSIDKIWCKKNGLAPPPIHVATAIDPITTPPVEKKINQYPIPVVDKDGNFLYYA